MNLNLNENLKINELIEIAIDTMNKKLDEERQSIRLSLKYSRYNVKQSKKNGLPKDDLPSIL